MGHLKVQCYTAEQVAAALVVAGVQVHPDALITRNVPEQCEPMYDIVSSIAMVTRLRHVSPEALKCVYLAHRSRTTWLSEPWPETIGRTPLASNFEMTLEACLSGDLEAIKSCLADEAGVAYVLPWAEYAEVLRWRMTGFGFLPDSVSRVAEMFMSLAPLSPAIDWPEWNRALGRAFPKLKLDHPVHVYCFQWAMERVIEDIEGLRKSNS